MAQIVRDITVDVAAQNIFQAIIAKQYDSKSRFLKVTLTDTGEKITIDASSTVIINALREDGESKAFSGEVNSDGTVTVPLTLWMLEKDGFVKCDISIVDADKRKLTSTLFSLNVEQAACPNSDISDDDNYDLLVNLISEASEANAAAQDAIKRAEQAVVEAAARAETVGTQLADVKSDLVQLGFVTGNLFNKQTVTRGFMILNDGSIRENSVYCYSDYIPVKANKTYCVSYAMSSPGGMYDENKNYVGTVYPSVSPVDYHTFTPTQNGFVRLNLLIHSLGRPNGDINGFIMSEGIELLSYPPYGKIANEKLELDYSQIKAFEDLVNKSNTLYGKNLVVFGDSRTWYDGHSYGDKTKADLKGNVCVGYQQTIKKMIDCNIVSEGVSGNTSAQICERIVACDFTDVDAVLLEGGVNDFVKQSSVTVGEISAIGSAFDASTVYGAWQTAIEYILTNYPTVKIYMTIPAIAWTSSGMFPYGTASIKKDIAELYNLPIVDLYKELGINEVNRDTFYCDDVELTNWRLHFNDYGNAVVGEKLAKFILNN